MKHLILILITLFSISSFAQDKEEQEALAQKKANDLVYEGNLLVNNDDYVSAEMEYRKAISEQPDNAIGAYNLGNSYYKKGNFEEALYRQKQTARNATTKDQKHRAFHNIGNILMQSKQCKEAAEAFKNALKNNPTDNETRYNFALAKECAEEQQEQQDENKDKNEDKKDDQEDKEKEQEDENKKEKPEDEGEKDKKEGEDKKDEEGKPKDEKEDPGKGEEEKKEKPKPQPGQLSPQQIKNLLEAMNDQEQKVQDKMNAQKQKGARVQTEKDW